MQLSFLFVGLGASAAHERITAPHHPAPHHHADHYHGDHHHHAHPDWSETEPKLHYLYDMMHNVTLSENASEIHRLQHYI